MLRWVDILFISLSALLLVPVLVVCLQCLLALLPRRRFVPDSPAGAGAAGAPARPRVAVLIPAHNEEAGLPATLRSLQPQLGPGDRVVVVADNCDDNTAAVARAQGCEVVERRDAQRRGKGYALDAGLRHLEGDPPDVLVMVDADCVVHGGAVDALVSQARSTGRPAQALYLMTYPPQSIRRHAVSALAFLVKNHVRPRGLARLGLPCLLTGTGMAFPWPVIRKADLASGNIVEDMQLGLDLALAGHAPLFCEPALVTGELPAREQAALGQRRRWEHGHLRTLFAQGPRLLKAGLLGGRPVALPLAMELAVPPLSLHVCLLGAVAAVAAALAAIVGTSWVPVWMLVGGLLALGLCVLAAWARFGRRQVPLSSLLGAPLYVLWKLPMYATFLRHREKEWVRTERAPASGATSPSTPQDAPAPAPAAVKTQ